MQTYLYKYRNTQERYFYDYRNTQEQYLYEYQNTQEGHIRHRGDGMATLVPVPVPAQ
jgi:hypothetical protein